MRGWTCSRNAFDVLPSERLARDRFVARSKRFSLPVTFK
jgi:hypothetical protein